MIKKEKGNFAYLMIVPIVILITVAIGVLILNFGLSNEEEKYYQYIDFQDEFGIANKCSHDNGVPICIDEKGVVILVKMYADITEEVNNAR